MNRITYNGNSYGCYLKKIYRTLDENGDCEKFQKMGRTAIHIYDLLTPYSKEKYKSDYFVLTTLIKQ